MRGKSLLVAASYPNETRLFVKYRRHSMVPRRRFTENLVIAQRATTKGDIVECGTWRGGMIAAVAERMPGRRYVLFDSFEGLPPAKPIDGERAAVFHLDDRWYHDNCTAAIEEAEEAMRMSGAENVSIRKGWFENTVPGYAAEQPTIAVLRIDGDWYDSTIICLRKLFPLVPEGGVVIFDDYDTWEGSTKAVHDYLSEAEAPEPIERCESGVAYLLKRGR